VIEPTILQPAPRYDPGHGGFSGMTTIVPIVGTGVVGLAVGCLMALTYDRSLLRGALWGCAGGLPFGSVAAIALAISP